MKKSLPAFIANVLDSETPIDETLQNAVYRSMVSRKLWSSLGRLAARADTSAEMDRLLGSRKEIDVLAGWVRRPGRTTEELVGRLSGEKRVKALLPLAERTDLPEAVYRHIAAQPSKTLAEALAANESAPRALRVAKIAELANSANASRWNIKQSLDRVIKGDESLLLDASPSVTGLVGIDLLLSMSIPAADTVGRYCDIVLATPKEQCDSGYGHSTFRDELLIALSQHRLDPKRRKRLAAALRKASRDATCWVGLRKNLTDAADNLEAFDDEAFRRIEAFEAETDPERASSLLAALLAPGSTPDMYARTRMAMVRHRHLPVEEIISRYDDLEYHEEVALFDELLRRGDYESIARVSLRSYYVQRMFHERTVDQRRLLAAMVSSARQRGIDLPMWVLHMYTGTLSHDDLIDLVPWPTLARELESFPGLSGSMSRRLSPHIAANPTFWENFEILADEFEGPLPELIEAAAAL